MVYLRARYYAPGVGRFLTADTVVPDPLRSVGWNRYGYVENNPVRYTDPNGHQGCLPEEVCFDVWKPIRELWESAPEVAPEAAQEMIVDFTESTIKAGEVVANAGCRLVPPTPDAALIGFSGSVDLSNPNGVSSVDFGMEDVLNFNNGQRTVFNYVLVVLWGQVLMSLPMEG